MEKHWKVSHFWPERIRNRDLQLIFGDRNKNETPVLPDWYSLIESPRDRTPLARMFARSMGSIGSLKRERAINPSSDRPSTGISDHKPRYAHCPTACSLAPAFGDRVISSDEFIHIRQADAPCATSSTYIRLASSQASAAQAVVQSSSSGPALDYSQRPSRCRTHRRALRVLDPQPNVGRAPTGRVWRAASRRCPQAPCGRLARTPARRGARAK
jgi:hypothetical protein